MLVNDVVLKAWRHSASNLSFILRSRRGTDASPPGMKPSPASQSQGQNEVSGNTNCNWCTRNGLLRLWKGTERVGCRRINRNNPNYSIVKIGHYTEKSPGGLMSLAVTQTFVKNHQQTLVWETWKKNLIIITWNF